MKHEVAMSENIRLYLDCRGELTTDSPEAVAWMEGADALVVDPRQCSPRQFESVPVEIPVLFDGDPERDAPWRETASHWVCAQGLETAAGLRDLHPALHWIPRLSVSRDRVSYRFSGPAIGEGFSFYMPDTSAIKGWRVNGTDLSLGEALGRATELGFDDLWLHSPDAASRGRGLELDLLDRTRGGRWKIWLSGGAVEARHLSNLAGVGGAATVVVDKILAQQCSLAELRDALLPETARPQAVTLHIPPRESGAGSP